MRKSFLIALLFSLYLASVLARIHHECVHDKKFGNQKKAQRQKLSTFEKRFRHFQPRRVVPIRIVLDYSNMARTLTSQERTFIESIMSKHNYSSKKCFYPKKNKKWRLFFFLYKKKNG